MPLSTPNVRGQQDGAFVHPKQLLELRSGFLVASVVCKQIRSTYCTCVLTYTLIVEPSKVAPDASWYTIEKQTAKKLGHAKVLRVFNFANFTNFEEIFFDMRHHFHTLTTRVSMDNIRGLSYQIHKKLSPRRYLRSTRCFANSCELEQMTVWQYGVC